MNQKYEFVEGDEVTTLSGVTLKRIRALVTIGATATTPAVNPEDLGGYIQSEANLSETGDAWVHGDAWVYGDARVSDNALVSDNARVCGDALVSDNGLIFWASKVGTENGTLTVYNGKDDTLLVTRGCFFGSPAEFLEKSKRVHDARTHHEYKLLIEVATSRIEAARARLLEPVERLALGFPQKEHFK